MSKMSLVSAALKKGCRNTTEAIDSTFLTLVSHSWRLLISIMTEKTAAGEACTFLVALIRVNEDSSDCV